MRPDVKFCGLMRPADAAMAADLGARYVGVIFAGGPRNLAPERAATVLAAAGNGVRRVGVFSSADRAAIASAVEVASLDVIQLHGDPTAEEIGFVQRDTRCEVWAVLRVTDGELPARADAVFAAADATLLDAHVPGRLGGTGVPIPWSALARALESVPRRGRIVLAGGLTAANVREAIDAVQPDVVDVSSGVEAAPGTKDHDQMRAFVEAAWA